MRPNAITPRKARKDFLKSKRQSIKESAARSYKYPTRHFVEYLEENGIEAMSDVDGYLLEQWKFDRAEDNIADITLQDSVKKVRVFIDWCGSMEIVDESLYEKIQVPDVSEEETVSADILPKERADKILQHLERYQYASRTHALFTFLWHTGCRISGAIAVDVGDYKPASNHVKFRNRPEQGTPLKNDHKSERNVNLSSEVIDRVVRYLLPVGCVRVSNGSIGRDHSGRTARATRSS